MRWMNGYRLIGLILGMGVTRRLSLAVALAAVLLTQTGRHH
jgi:hypothetical protein